MLNIISLQALRKKSTGPSKVAKNLIKGLELIGEPYIINGDPTIFKNIYILDDENFFRNIKDLPEDCEIIAGPILHRKKNIPEDIADKYKFVYASNWIKNLGDKYKRHKHSIVRPVGIDTYSYLPSTEKKDQVLIYFKTRYKEELEYCESLLKEKNIKYNIINYDTGYNESDFINYLKRSKYVIRIGCSETQGIALGEVLSMNIPILLRDIKKIQDWNPDTKYKKDCFNKEEGSESATSAEYFDERCGIRFYDKSDLKKNIDKMGKLRNYEFSPRNYIMENLSLEKQAKELLSYYSNKDKGNNLKKKYMKSNFILRLGFFFLDNSFFKPFYNFFVNLYQKITKISK